MRQSDWCQVVLFLLMIGAVLFATTPALRILCIMPNFVLAIMVIFLLTSPGLGLYFILLLAAAVGLSVGPVVGLPAFATVVVGLFLYWLRARFLAGGLLSVFFLVLLGTVATYLIVEPGFLLEAPVIVLLEFVYTIGTTALLLIAIRLIFNETITGSTI